MQFGDIKSQISPEKLPFYSKEQLLYYCKELRLKTTGEKKDLIERLSPLGKCPELFDKKVKQITVKFSFPTALVPTEIPQPSADWKVLGKDKEVGAPVVTDSVIQDYQKAKYAGSKGQYRKAYRMFSSRRTVSVKILKDGNNPRYTYIKANMLKSYTGSISRPVTVQFVENKPIKAYCSCPVGKSGLCCHAIALLIQLKFLHCNKKLHLHMSCTERLQKWHAKGSTANQKVASQIKLKYLRNLRGARADIKRVRQKKKVQVSSSAEYDYSDWYRRDVSKIEEEVKVKVGQLKPVEDHVYSVLSKYKKQSPLFLHLRYKKEYQEKAAGKEYNEEVLKPRFQNNAEAIWRPQKPIEYHQRSNSVTATCASESQDCHQEMTSLLQRSNYVPVDQCTLEWRALRVGVITASKAPALLGFCGVKEFDNAWFAIKNNIDETVMNPKRAKLPNFIRGKKEEKNAITRFCTDSKSVVIQCGYFKHPSDKRFGASPDGISCGQPVFLVEIKTHSLPNKKQLEKLIQGEQVKIEAMQTPLPQVRKIGYHLILC